jgi:hypothetical protein
MRLSYAIPPSGPHLSRALARDERAARATYGLGGIGSSVSTRGEQSFISRQLRAKLLDQLGQDEQALAMQDCVV